MKLFLQILNENDKKRFSDLAELTFVFEIEGNVAKFFMSTLDTVLFFFCDRLKQFAQF